MTKIGAHIERYVQGFYPKLVSDGNSCDGIGEISYKKLFAIKLLSSKRIVFVKSIEINTGGELKFPNLKWLFYSNDITIKLVGDCACMFLKSKFNQDISQWDVSNAMYMSYMFYESKFNQDISSWDVSRVSNMDGMFYCSKFNQDISAWDVSSVINKLYVQ